MARETQSNSVGSFQSQSGIFRIGLDVMHFQLHRFALSVFQSAPLASVGIADKTITDEGFIFRLRTFNDSLRSCSAFPHRMTVAFVTAFCAVFRLGLLSPSRTFENRSAIHTVTGQGFALPVPMFRSRSCRFAGAGIGDFLAGFGRSRRITERVISVCHFAGHGAKLSPLRRSGNEVLLAK